MVCRTPTLLIIEGQGQTEMIICSAEFCTMPNVVGKVQSVRYKLHFLIVKV